MMNVSLFETRVMCYQFPFIYSEILSQELNLPCNEENSAFGNIPFRHKLKIINSISTLISRKTGSEILKALGWFSKLLHNNLLLLLLNLINYVAICPFSLELQKPELTVIMDSHARCRISLSYCKPENKSNG